MFEMIIFPSVTKYWHSDCPSETKSGISPVVESNLGYTWKKDKEIIIIIIIIIIMGHSMSSVLK